MGTKLVGDHLSRGTKFLWTICPVQWDQIFGDHLTLVTKFDGDRLSRGINLMGIVSPGGQEVGDRKWGTGSGGLEVRGSNGFWTKSMQSTV